MNPTHRLYHKCLRYYLLVLVSLFLSSCSSEKKDISKHPLKGEYIYRFHNEFFFTSPLPRFQSRSKYPWEDKYIGSLPRITKDFFRCKGNNLNPVVIHTIPDKDPIKYYDCPGGKKHGLPIRNGKEFVYPCLIELLNYIQQKTNKRVIITSGHRCPKHNTYLNPTSNNWSSKHMLGAEVDFYVRGMEHVPLVIVELIKQYYAETEPFSSSKEYTLFHQYEKEKLNLSTAPWYNKEIFVKLYHEQEGRNCDNQHPYPYLSIQVRHDRDLNTKVLFDQKQSQNYLRH